MKTEKPATGSGKTRFNKGKSKGESWTDRRDKYLKKKNETRSIFVEAKDEEN